MPERIQLSRKKGWRMPPNTVKVSRPGRWGNPFRIGDTVHKGPAYSGRNFVVRDATQAVELYREWLWTQKRSEDMILELRGKNLACWCKPGEPCHADVLLELANSETPAS